MISKIERLFTFILNPKTRKFCASISYIWLIAIFMNIDFPFVLEIICIITLVIILLFGVTLYFIEWLEKKYEQNKGKLGKNIILEIKKIGKEILMFIPILFISNCITSFIMIGKPENERYIEEVFGKSPIFYSICIIIIGPIIEEFIFRFLPARFITNKTLYIIISAVVFAAMHVVHDSNPLYYFWFYLLRPLFYGYRYYETQDIWVPISMHSFNNLTAILPLMLLYF